MIATPTVIQSIGAALFAIALVHTFSTKYFERLAHQRPDHAGIYHLLGEVEIVFGVWAGALILAMMLVAGRDSATTYLDSRDFTEPLFVFAIMVVAGSRPILELANAGVRIVAGALPMAGAPAMYFTVLAFVPLLGSFITEPAAMTLAALILRDRFFASGLSNRLKYATVGTLFVNISIGGVLTSFAAPPVLMVAGKWGWDTAFMMETFGWRAASAVLINAAIVTWMYRRELAAMEVKPEPARQGLPKPVLLLHAGLLVAVVMFSHHPALFLGLLLLFLGFATAYPQYQDRIILREGLLVAFFLAGLVVLGGQQRWWLEPLLRGMDSDAVFYGAVALTAVTDNAALTYLGSLVEGLSDEFKYSLVAGAVAGGGLTVIANAPNPAGFAILRRSFHDEAIHPWGLLTAALTPTLVAILFLKILH
jgi:Putative Na+/H+ antiporter